MTEIDFITDSAFAGGTSLQNVQPLLDTPSHSAQTVLALFGLLHNLSEFVLIALLSVALAVPARAETLQTAGDQIIAGIVVVSAGITVLVIFLVLHQKHKQSTITGCVTRGATGTSLIDEKDKQLYLVSGDPLGLKPGDRMTLEGKRKKTGKDSTFEARAVKKDFGLCQQ
jgi:hypothetical protein